MVEAGVACFKIEGRLKGPEYVAVTTKVGGAAFLGG
jgi:collagenase-like PrtC family protease